jgi:hypothetical protein
MHELVEIDSPAAHSCVTPNVERWHVYEPVSMRWSWLSVFQCCGQVYDESERATSKTKVEVQKAA